jgi:hypothetical protein
MLLISPPPTTNERPDGIEHQNGSGDCDFQHNNAAPSSRSALTAVPSRVWIATFDIRTEV